MLEAIFTIIGTVIGAILGFLLSEWAQSRREEREEKRLAKAVQVLISVEIDTNLKKLKDFWSDVNDPDGLTEKEDIRKIEVARRLIIGVNLGEMVIEFDDFGWRGG